MIALHGAAYAGAWISFVVLGDSWWQLAVAAVLAVVYAQASFLGHDASHEQAFASHRANALAAFVHGNVLVGTSYAWWVDEHNRHHRHPNDADRDPNVADIVLSLTRENAARRRGPRRLLAAYQAWLYFPLALLEGFNLHYVSIRALADPSVRYRDFSRRTEGATLALHTAVYLSAVFAVLPIGTALAFVAVHQGLWGLYLGLVFAPNHKGMPVSSGYDARNFVSRQTETARNIRGGRLVSFWYGGLNNQIEHHLFPLMPRPALRLAAPIVAEFCAEHGIAYTSETVTGTYSRVLRHLHDVGADTRGAARPTR